MDLENRQLSALDIDILQTFVEGVRMLGLPKSIGEIYGLLYLSPEPLSMDMITSILNISTGSASQGLRQLRVFKAVHVRYMPGERREYYLAETDLRRLVAGYFKQEVYPHLTETTERLEALRDRLPVEGDTQSQHYRNRFSALTSWHRKSAKWLRRMVTFIDR